MNKTEFINKLEKKLKYISKEDREDAICFYKEYIEDMGYEGNTLFSLHTVCCTFSVTTIWSPKKRLLWSPNRNNISMKLEFRDEM